MDPLAAADDVAHALGLEDADALSASQSARVDSLLLRVSREFRREAERVFTPGTTTVRLLTVAGRVHLTETVDEVEEVTYRDCRGEEVVLGFEVDGQDLIVDYNGQVLPSGIPVTVTYTHTADVPDEVKATVAAIVARHLTVDPASAEAKATELAAGPFRTRYADWTSNHALLTPEECEQARSYRYPASSIIIHRS